MGQRQAPTSRRCCWQSVAGMAVSAALHLRDVPALNSVKEIAALTSQNCKQPTAGVVMFTSVAAAHAAGLPGCSGLTFVNLRARPGFSKCQCCRCCFPRGVPLRDRNKPHLVTTLSSRSNRQQRGCSWASHKRDITQQRGNSADLRCESEQPVKRGRARWSRQLSTLLPPRQRVYPIVLSLHLSVPPPLLRRVVFLRLPLPLPPWWSTVTTASRTVRLARAQLWHGCAGKRPLGPLPCV